ncbi:PREDICTED: aspartyl protease family protein At5g10770-like [Ipomoea nil]|uniref:aspartyl protease family protein At5g10770-like n=1 Tax=Ipomoea nil TaxID=35883 RepID=UPI00090095C0|nr:PREDICTED: aspartyl protease family protein At5g10770-like [Ipomoea nil]
MGCRRKLSSADRMLKLPLLLLLLLQSSANVFILLIIIMLSCGLGKGNASEQRVGLEAHHHHTLPLTSMLPPFVCNTTTSKGPSRKASMKVVHRFGPCSARIQDSPTVSELLLHDESRVNSIQARVAKTKGEMSESKTANLPAEHESPGGVGNYVVTVGLGTPEKELDLVFDTGSHLTWTQCQPCAGKCYKQSATIFDPAASTSYSNVSCTSPACSALQSATLYRPFCVDSTTCVYRVSYGDGSFSIGEFAKDKLSLSATDLVDGFLFGCGQNNHLFFGDNAGLMGLGRDGLSIVSQTSQQYGKYFSYCLPTRTGSDGHLTLGKTNNNNNLRFTPFSSSQDKTGLYFIDVLAISVNGRQLPIGPAVFKASGTIIDSGTVITRLPPAAYAALRDAFRQGMAMYPAVSSGGRSSFDTCYDFTGYPNPNIPKISFTFGGDLVVDLGPRLTMLPLQGSASQLCLAFLGNRNASDVGILGNFQQQTLEVVYDVAGGKLGFASGGCS